MDYDGLREEYPAIISMDQLYRICRISKRKAVWLLENGVIPCEDSGRQTRRFRIRLEDVIDFLQRLEAGELDGEIPVGAFSSGGHGQAGQPLDSEALVSLLLEAWCDAPDMLTARQAAELTGYGTTTVNEWALRGKVAFVCYHSANLISKESLAEYLASPAGQRIAVKSDEHRAAMEQLRREQNSGMEFGSMSL
jgi:hypothetical protein